MMSAIKRNRKIRPGSFRSMLSGAWFHGSGGSAWTFFVVSIISNTPDYVIFSATVILVAHTVMTCLDFRQEVRTSRYHKELAAAYKKGLEQEQEDQRVRKYGHTPIATSGGGPRVALADAA